MYRITFYDDKYCIDMYNGMFLNRHILLYSILRHPGTSCHTAVVSGRSCGVADSSRRASDGSGGLSGHSCGNADCSDRVVDCSGGAYDGNGRVSGHSGGVADWRGGVFGCSGGVSDHSGGATDSRGATLNFGRVVQDSLQSYK